MKHLRHILWFVIVIFLQSGLVRAQEQTPQLLLGVDFISPDGEINVAAEGETVTLHILANGGFMEETLMDNVQSFISNISWITNAYLTNKEGIYEADLNFVIDENDTENLRSVIITASNGSAILKQYSSMQAYSISPPSITLIHGDRGTIILSGSESGSEYLLTSSNPDYIPQSRYGTDDTLHFFVSDTGVFKCYDITQQHPVQMRDSCLVQWESFYNKNRNCNLASNPYRFPKEGGTVTFNYNVLSGERTALQRIINSYNSGNNSSWNSHMSISVSHVNPSTSNITVSCPANTTGLEIYNDTYFKNLAGDYLVFIQDAWSMEKYRLLLKDSLNSRRLVLDGSENGVPYNLYRNGQPYGMTRTGNGDSLSFYIPSQPGKYHVWAEMNSVCVVMDGTLTVTDDGKAVMGENWIMKQTYTASQGASSVMDITYYDDLGYPAQIINVSASPEGNNIITPVWYDPMRRDDAKSYLPYASSSDLTQPEEQPFEKQRAFYASHYGQNDALYSYSEKVYEPSPLNRVLRQFTPGADFRQTTANSSSSDHYTAISYEFNDSNEVLTLLCSNDGNLTVSGFMAEATLYKTTTTSPDGRTTTEFKDSEGTLYLQRSGSGTDIQETYYAYDGRRRLRWVIQPEGSARIKALAANSSSANPYTITQADSTAQKFCFLYAYDGRNQMTEKKIPGKGLEYMIYDRAGRLVATQDSILRSQNSRWMLTRYDSLGRVTDVFRSSPMTMQLVKSGFSQSAYPIFYTYAGNAVLSSALYGKDGDTFSANNVYSSDIPSYLAFEEVDGVAEEADIDSRTASLLLYDKTLDMTTLASNPKRYRERAYYYDKKGRVIQTVEKEPDGEILRTSVEYDFVGNPLTSVQTLEKGTNTTIQDNTGIGQDGKNTLTQVFTYDSRGRKLTSATYLNNSLSDTWSAANYSYDELGRLISAENGKTSTQGSSALSPSTSTPVLSNTLAYNIQGWMTVQTDSLKKGTGAGNVLSLYSQTLRYHNPIKTASQKSYDGLITEWETVQYSDGTDFTLPGSTQDKNTYAFTYDNQGRLASSSRYAGGNTNPNSSFTEKNFSFDKNGNILTLTRYGAGDATIKDSFTYSYSGNRIEKLEGTHDGSAITHNVQNNSVAGTADYIYDGNGNMTFDALRHISMTYDLNNLVSTVSRDGSPLSTYTYLADGTKYKVKDCDGNGRYYIGPFCLGIEKTGTGSSAVTKAYLESIDAETGRILAIRQASGSGANITETTSYSTVFFVKDHLGSVRAIVDSQGNILERNAYYPFGLQMAMGKAYPSISSSLTILYPNILSSTQARRDLYNGKELQTVAGTDYIDYGFRQYDPVTARWMAVDPKAEKYLFVSPYVYCLDIPIVYADLRGTTLWIRTKEVTLQYENGLLYNNDGTLYTDKKRGYIKQVFNALEKISKSKKGQILISSLQASENQFYIEFGPNEFDEDIKQNAYAKQLQEDQDPSIKIQYEAIIDKESLIKGSGGIIKWNPREGYLDTGNEERTLSPATNLAHEMAHAFDANYGLIDGRIENGLVRKEWQAVYWENSIREELALPLRVKYGTTNILNNGSTIKPQWYHPEIFINNAK